MAVVAVINVVKHTKTMKNNDDVLILAQIEEKLEEIILKETETLSTLVNKDSARGKYHYGKIDLAKHLMAYIKTFQPKDTN